MKRHALRATVLTGAFALVLSGMNALPAATAQEGPTVSMSYDTPLHDGDPITVDGTGFTPGDHLAGECVLQWVPGDPTGYWNVGDCAGSSMTMLAAGEDGVLAGTVPAVQGIQRGDVQPQVTVTPGDYLLEGQVVTVTGTDFPSYGNVTDCQNPGDGQRCAAVVWQDDSTPVLADGSLQGAFAQDWAPPVYELGQTVSQQLESIILVGDLSTTGRFADNVQAKRAPIDPQTGAFTTQYLVHRWLDFTDVAYALQGYPPEPVWSMTWPPPEGVVLYDATLDCAQLPAKQAGREIQDPQCDIAVMQADGGPGNWGMQQVTFKDQRLTLATDPYARLLKGSRQVQLSGTVTCSDRATVHLEGTLSQQQRKGVVVRATVRADVLCDGTTGWAATAYTPSGKFLAGSATVTLSATSPGFTPVNGQQNTVSLVTIR